MRRGFLVAGAWLTIALPAHADTTTAVSFADACGDNHPFVEANGTRQDLPGTDRTPRFDLKRLTVDRVADGVSVRIETCSPIGAPDGFKGWRSVYVTFPDGCQLQIGALEGTTPSDPRTAHVIKTCFTTTEPVDAPVVGPVPETGGSSANTRFDITLPASSLTVADGALLITVHRSDLTNPDAAAAFALGTTWPGFYAVSEEDPETTFGFGGPADQNNFRWTAPSGVDTAQTSQPFTT